MSSPAASVMLDRRGEYRAGASSLLDLPLPKRLTESAAEQLSKKQRRRARRAVDEAVLAILLASWGGSSSEAGAQQQWIRGSANIRASF